MKKVAMAQSQTKTAMLTVMNSMGIRTRRAIPIQKKQKANADITAKATVERQKEMNRPNGSAEKKSWEIMKACSITKLAAHRDHDCRTGTGE